jgi:hypothetical protein
LSRSSQSSPREESRGDWLKEKDGAGFRSGLEWLGLEQGKATAVLFAREGAKVLAADINLDVPLETKRIIEAEGSL